MGFLFKHQLIWQKSWVNASENLARLTVGNTGAAGAVGNTGAVGAVGNTGAAGAVGNTGVTGAVGNAGLNGVTGKTGATGAVNTYAVGQPAFGGIVGYVDSTGQHGFVVACADSALYTPYPATTGAGLILQNKDSVANATPSTSSSVSGVNAFVYTANTSSVTIGANASGVGGGAINTAAILGGQNAGSGANSSINAAAIANMSSYREGIPGAICSGADPSVTDCISGYYLPSASELLIMAKNFNTINTGISAGCTSSNVQLLASATRGANTPYWSSTEINASSNTVSTASGFAYAMVLSQGATALGGYQKTGLVSVTTNPSRVRAIRAF